VLRKEKERVSKETGFGTKGRGGEKEEKERKGKSPDFYFLFSTVDC